MLGDERSRPTLVFLVPLVYRPHKTNFARRFELLSKRCSGYIFSLSGSRCKNLAIANFLFYSESTGGSAISRLFNNFRSKILLPIALLLKTNIRPDAIIAYDPYISGFSGVILKLFFRTKLIVEINGDYHKLEPSHIWIKNLLAKILLYASLQLCDTIKVGNTDQLEFYRKR